MKLSDWNKVLSYAQTNAIDECIYKNITVSVEHLPSCNKNTIRLDLCDSMDNVWCSCYTGTHDTYAAYIGAIDDVIARFNEM